MALWYVERPFHANQQCYTNLSKIISKQMLNANAKANVIKCVSVKRTTVHILVKMCGTWLQFSMMPSQSVKYSVDWTQKQNYGPMGSSHQQSEATSIKTRGKTSLLLWMALFFRNGYKIWIVSSMWQERWAWLQEKQFQFLQH